MTCAGFTCAVKIAASPALPAGRRFAKSVSSSLTRTTELHSTSNIRGVVTLRFREDRKCRDMDGGSGTQNLLGAIPDANFAIPDPGDSSQPLHPVVITLDRRIDRWQLIRQSLTRAGLTDVTKFSAVDGATISAATRAALVDPRCDIDAPPRSHLALTRPAAGCFLSHLQIWKKFLASGAEHVVVLEDDATPMASYSAEQASALLRSIPANADIVLLGCWIMGDLAENPDHRPLRRIFYFNGTFAYLLTRRGCLNLLPYLLPMRAHIDHQISAALICNPDELHAYVATPFLFDHDFSTESGVYIPLEGPEAADQELGALIDSAREALRPNLTGASA
jgi:glycosyl transferase family 25